MSKSFEIKLGIAVIIIALFVICGKTVKAESAIITFTDAEDLEQRVDSIGAVCFVSHIDTIGSHYELDQTYREGDTLTYLNWVGELDTVYTCRSISWVAVLRTPEWSKFFKCVISGQALVVWEEVR